MEQEPTNEKYFDSQLVEADELAAKGRKAFLSYAWKLNMLYDDSYASSETSNNNPYSDDEFTNDLTFKDHDLEIAFDYYQQALAKYEKILGPDHIKTAEILANCGDVCSELKYDYVTARQYYDRAFPIYRKEKPNSRDLAVLYENYGSFCYQMNDLLTSLDYYHKSLTLYNKLTICGEEFDTSNLKERINEAEKRLGLHVVVIDDKYGFADIDEHVVIPCQWNKVDDFSEGLAGVADGDNLWGYINYLGELAIPCEYKMASPFNDGMAIVQDNTERVFPQYRYIGNEGNFIAFEQELSFSEIETIYQAKVLASFGKYEEAADRISPVVKSAFPIDNHPRDTLILYLMISKQYEKVIDWCKRIISHDERGWSWPYILLGNCYEEGLGVEKNLLEAFRCYNNVHLAKMANEENLKEIDKFLDRHPEMLELPEVQNALAPFDENEDY